MAERRDFLPVCNDQGVQLADFQATFCARCVQPECSRSHAGGRFESRVSTWQDRLFINPPRMPKHDPLYASLAAKRFLDIDVGRTPELSNVWVDPHALTEPEVEAPKPRPAKSSSASRAVADGGTMPGAAVSRAPLNSTFRQGTMIGGEDTKPQKASDPWAAPLETPPTAPIVRSGAKLKFR
jgi:hypothetical protein